MLIIIISRSSLKLGHVRSKTTLLGQQTTQVSDLGSLWPSCFFFTFKIVQRALSKHIRDNQISLLTTGIGLTFQCICFFGELRTCLLNRGGHKDKFYNNRT